MSDSDDGTITVEIEPDNSGEMDSNNNGIADGIEIGEASANAEHAADTAENAAQSAENAQNTADAALTETINNSANIDALASATAANTASLQQLITQVQAMTEVLQAQAQLQLEQAETTPLQPRPEDEEPRNTHWTQKRISFFGGRG